MDRGKKMVTLALNKTLAEQKRKMKEDWLNKKANICLIKKRTDREYLDDPDFTTMSIFSGDSNFSGGESISINNDPEPNNSSSEAPETIPNQEGTSPGQECPESLEMGLTKNGHIRIRKNHHLNPSERKSAKRAKIIDAHQVRESCSDICKFKCKNYISHERRVEINQQFWKLPPKDQKWFIFKNTSKVSKKRSTVYESVSRRAFTFKYFLPKELGAEEASTNVCKTFFLTTLGYNKNNDRVVRNIITKSDLAPPEDKRGKHEPSNKINREVVKQHVESFRPQVSHYRREHAPNRRYLPGDVNQTLMYNHFREQNPTFKIGYETYSCIVREMNISFATLGHEECWVCDKFKKHKEISGHTENCTQENDCQHCNEWKVHNKKYLKAREQYKRDAEQENGMHFSADLQKVVNY